MSSTLSSITSGASSLFNAGLNYGGQAVVILKGAALSSGHYFAAFVNTPATNLIGGVVAKVNALGSPLLGPVAAGLVTLGLGLLANRLLYLKTDENSWIARPLVKIAAVALAIFAGCAAAATVAMLSAAIPAYAAYAAGALVTSASLLLPINVSKGDKPKENEVDVEKTEQTPAPAKT